MFCNSLWLGVHSVGTALFFRLFYFYGTSENAVKTQIWVAVSVYVLVAIVKSKWGWS